MDSGRVNVTEEAQIEVTPAPMLEPMSYPITILLAMNRLGKHIYEGTVSDKVKAARRKAGRVAKRQRKINR